MVFGDYLGLTTCPLYVCIVFGKSILNRSACKFDRIEKKRRNSISHIGVIFTLDEQEIIPKVYWIYPVNPKQILNISSNAIPRDRLFER